jgi:uncharacterized NAD-dependent epimerase/dehydratase family protein
MALDKFADVRDIVDCVLSAIEKEVKGVVSRVLKALVKAGQKIGVVLARFYDASPQAFKDIVQAAVRAGMSIKNIIGSVIENSREI